MSYFGGGLLLGPGKGDTSSALGLTFPFKALGRDTRGAHLAFEFELPPGEGVPPHIYHDEEEAIVVVSGELTNRVGDEVTTILPGLFCLVPRGTVHGQTNEGTEPVRLFLVISPPRPRRAVHGDGRKAGRRGPGADGEVRHGARRIARYRLGYSHRNSVRWPVLIGTPIIQCTRWAGKPPCSHREE